MNAPERTPDGRYIVVAGRRWRASDPGIPAKLRQELVDELMAARRLVRSDPENARPRVQDAKVALGERGYPWWQAPSDEERDTRIEATIRALLRHRAGTTICPSDVARVVGGSLGVTSGAVGESADDGSKADEPKRGDSKSGDSRDEAWRDLMPAVRAVAHRMRAAGEVRVTQKGADVDESASGPVRIAPATDSKER